jgi:hypothetical protein
LVKKKNILIANLYPKLHNQIKISIQNQPEFHCALFLFTLSTFEPAPPCQDASFPKNPYPTPKLILKVQLQTLYYKQIICYKTFYQLVITQASATESLHQPLQGLAAQERR